MGMGGPIPLPVSLTAGQPENAVDIIPPLGNHIELTIDNYLQHLAEKELFAMAKHTRAEHGSSYYY